MNTQLNTRSKGFTIIEVVLVLAIAGLIFLMVFIALPALQRSQRDTQRRNDASKFISQTTSYATNNRGQAPAHSADLSTDRAFATSYLKWAADSSGEFNDPTTGVGYEFVTAYANLTTAGQVYYGGRGTKCSGENVVSSSNAREAAVAFKLEGSGTFCTSNQ